MIICQICHLKPRPGFGLRVVRSTKNIMSFERTDAVALVKKVTGVDVPSAFFFERKNPAAQQVVDWAERATGLKEQALRALLEAGGFTGDNAVPEGTALWRLAWVHRASSPNTSEQVVGAFLAGRFPEETARQTAAHRARGVQGAEAGPVRSTKTLVSLSTFSYSRGVRFYTFFDEDLMLASNMHARQCSA
ncbi:hypothetical protein DIPPA_06322 [Diplonema papillatum]|nr:hypothetical protein DIPPA_06322 [Diplonema papillatum]